MSGIFISYRREDSQSAAGRLADHLDGHLKDVPVFRDVETLAPGVDFVEAITKAISASDIVLVVIGPRWLTITNPKGTRRLDDPSDYHRQEISNALTLQKLVIPVLVDGARMPEGQDLPEELQKLNLTRRNAHELSDRRWDFDVAELAKAIRTSLGPELAQKKRKSWFGAGSPSSAEDTAGLGPIPASDKKGSLLSKVSVEYTLIFGFSGTLSVLSGNLLGVLGHNTSIKLILLRLLGISNLQVLHDFVTMVVLLLFAFGYLLFACSITLAFGKRLVKWKLFSLAILVSTVAGLACYKNAVIAIPPRPDLGPLLDETKRSLSSIIFSHYVQDGGGFRFSQSGASPDATVWTTAQCLYAVIAADADVSDHAQAIRKAFRYFDAVRVNDGGWAYVDDLPWGVTEISGWVVLAYLASVNPDVVNRIWETQQIPNVISDIDRELSWLVQRQHDDGGWGPISKTSDPRHLRTYSTIMALWALVEAQRNPLVKQHFGERLSENTRVGIDWLINSYRDREGWMTYHGRRTSGEMYPGLTAQALYVLIRAEDTYHFLSTNPRLKAAKRDFLALALDGFNGIPPLVSRSASDNERVHDSDRYLPGVPYTVEQTAFLWYPWTLLTASALRTDEQLTDIDRNRAMIIVDALIQRFPDFIDFAHNDPSLYPTAEGLLSIALHSKMIKSGNE